MILTMTGAFAFGFAVSRALRCALVSPVAWSSRYLCMQGVEQKVIGDLLVDIARHADTTLRTVHLGTAAIGELLVSVSPEIGTGEFPANTIEAIGWLLTELGDLAATAHLLLAGCQRFTSDYAPRRAKHIPPARP